MSQPATGAKQTDATRKKSEQLNLAVSEIPTNGDNGGKWPDLVEVYHRRKRERDWFAVGAIEKNPIALLIAPEKSGKSWALIDLAVATVTGGKWLEQFECVRKGPVAFVDYEYGADEFVRRVARICRARGVEVEAVLRQIRHVYDPRLVLCGALIRSGSELTDREKEQRKPLVQLAKALREDPPSLVILDPLRNGLPGNENDSDVALQAFLALQVLRNAGGCPVIVSHHVNKAGGYSGSRALLGRADLIFEGSDESPPWFGVKGRTVRHADPVSARFVIEHKHEQDHDDEVASTRVVARFEGTGEMSKTARQVLQALERAGDQVSIRQLRTATGRNNEIVKRALAELEKRGMAECENRKWSATLGGLFGAENEP